MNYKNYECLGITVRLGIMALILMIALAVAPAMASISDGGYVNKYLPVSAYSTANQMSYAGHVYGNLKSGGVLGGGEVFLIHRDRTADNTSITAKFTPDGQWDGYLAAGDYTLTLPQGTGSAAGAYSDEKGWVGDIHAETAHIKVVAGKESYFTFIGNSIPTGRGIPDPASIDAYFGQGDIDLKWMKIVKTGQHPYTYPAWDETYYQYIITPYSPEVQEVRSGWVTELPEGKDAVETRTVTDSEAHYTVVHASFHHGQWDGNCRLAAMWETPDFYSDNHVAYKFRNHGEFTYTYHDVVTHDEYKYIITPYSPATMEVISDWVFQVPAGKTVVDTQVIHHPEVTIQIPEYGIEFFIEIDGAHIDVTNPNNDPVNVEFQFDVNYFIDKRPWDNKVDDGRIVPRSKTYTGTLTSVGSGASTYHGMLNPDIDNAVTVADWSEFGLQYVPTITNDIVTGTVWA